MPSSMSNYSIRLPLNSVNLPAKSFTTCRVSNYKFYTSYGALFNSFDISYSCPYNSLRKYEAVVSSKDFAVTRM